MTMKPNEDREATPVHDEERAVYIISVAAELAGVHPQTLRIYERKGLLAPKRTSGNTRRYSERDIQTLRHIQDLTQETGVNLAGVKVIIELQAQLDALHARTDDLQQQLRAREDAADAARIDGKIVPLRSVFLPPWQARRPR
jgi:MerR family transcriptional regulator/heat shock protein HspR